MWEYFSKKEIKRRSSENGLKKKDRQKVMQGQWQVDSSVKKYLEQIGRSDDTHYAERMMKKGLTRKTQNGLLTKSKKLLSRWRRMKQKNKRCSKHKLFAAHYRASWRGHDVRFLPALQQFPCILVGLRRKRAQQLVMRSEWRKIRLEATKQSFDCTKCPFEHAR